VSRARTEGVREGAPSLRLVCYLQTPRACTMMALMAETTSADLTILLVDDERSYRASLKRLLAADGLCFVEAESGEQALALVAEQSFDLALVDVWMPGMDGLALVPRLKEKSPDLTVIMLTAFGDVEVAVEAMRAGASDFLEKGHAEHGLRARIAQLRRIRQLENDNRALRAEASRTFEFPGLLGDSPPMRRLKEAITRVGPADVSVLVEGETGTGKELVARAIHHHSRRSGGPFIVVDCASINESLMESELFGHVKGAYTGALAAHEGLFRAANGGTVFLDEVGEIPLAIQVKLLRVLQEREVRAVGSVHPSPVDIRVVAATNRKLSECVERGSFREDLYFRIAVVTLEVPPLRSRGDDIDLLATAFVARLPARQPPVRMHPEALRRLRAHDWPGNIRELENMIQRGSVMMQANEIRAEDLPLAPEEDEPIPLPGAAAAAAQPAGDPPPVQGDSLDSYERAAIVNALAKCGGSRRAAARMLGIGPATLYRKLHEYNLG
jgi:DNA-binding NtrC family response regulator